MGLKKLTQNSSFRLFLAGSRDLLPILLSSFPFGIIVGVSTYEAGMEGGMMAFFVLVVYAGAAQLAILQLMQENAPIFVIVFTALIINWRFMLYSAGLSVFFIRLGAFTRFLMAYLSTDQSYGVLMTRRAKAEAITRKKNLATEEKQLEKQGSKGLKTKKEKIFPAHLKKNLSNQKSFINRIGESKKNKTDEFLTLPPMLQGLYFLGASIFFYLAWQGAVQIGYIYGGALLENFDFRFMVPLTFLTLLLATIVGKGYRLLAVALLSGTIALFAKNIPLNMGFLLAVGSGLALAAYFSKRR